MQFTSELIRQRNTICYGSLRSVYPPTYLQIGRNTLAPAGTFTFITGRPPMSDNLQSVHTLWVTAIADSASFYEPAHIRQGASDASTSASQPGGFASTRARSDLPRPSIEQGRGISARSQHLAHPATGWPRLSPRRRRHSARGVAGRRKRRPSAGSLRPAPPGRRPAAIV